MEVGDSLVSNRQHPGESTLPYFDHIRPIGHGFGLQQIAGSISSYSIDSMADRARWWTDDKPRSLVIDYASR